MRIALGFGLLAPCLAAFAAGTAPQGWEDVYYGCLSQQENNTVRLCAGGYGETYDCCGKPYPEELVRLLGETRAARELAEQQAARAAEIEEGRRKAEVERETARLGQHRVKEAERLVEMRRRARAAVPRYDPNEHRPKAECNAGGDPNAPCARSE
jgi:hypothetical protein